MSTTSLANYGSSAEVGSSHSSTLGLGAREPNQLIGHDLGISEVQIAWIEQKMAEFGQVATHHDRGRAGGQRPSQSVRRIAAGRFHSNFEAIEWIPRWIGHDNRLERRGGLTGRRRHG